MTPKKILIMGLPGAGKTTLAYALGTKMDAVVYDGYYVRKLFQHVDFSAAGRLRQAEIMRDLCDSAMESGHTAIAAFVCPTHETRELFWGDTPQEDRFMIFVDRVVACEFQDTNAMFVAPFLQDYTVHPDETTEETCGRIMSILAGPMDWQKPTAIFIGRYQPFHDGHRKLIVTGIEKYGQAFIGVRQMPRGLDNPYHFDAVADMIDKALAPSYAGKYAVYPLPNVAAVLYGRDVGYKVEEVRLPPNIEAISATKIRKGEQL